MKKLLLFLIIIAPALGFGHSQPLPVVSIHFTVDEGAVTCRATIPTFAFEPTKNLSEDCSKDELEALKPAIADVLDARCPVQIDGIKVKPVISSVHLYAPPQRGPETYLEGVEPLAKPWVEANIKYSYSLKSKPDQVSMTWSIFPQESALEANIVEVDIDDLNEALAKTKYFGHERMVSFAPDETVYLWHQDSLQKKPITPVAITPPVVIYHYVIISLISIIAFLSTLTLTKRTLPKYFSTALISGTFLVAIFSVGLLVKNAERWNAARSGPNEAEALRIFSVLHSNLYRAFDYEQESDIYDALENSVSGEMLEKTYVDILKSMDVKDGPFIQIDRVRIKDSNIIAAESGEQSIGIDCTWRVTGLITHYEHVHSRVNEYRGIFTLKPIGDNWKITDLVIKGYERVTR